jgi:uncharacterized protein YbcI
MSESENGSPQREIARGIVSIYKEYLGRGPRVAKTVIGDEYVMTILEDGLTKAELRLIDADEAETARSIRRKFQEAMRTEIVALVERVTGRSAKSFMSDHDVLSDTAVELVTLEPNGGGG